ncbi:MAG: transporter [Rhodobacterales bacterium]|nr:MAG: transporter [Rhodobacterales bacterium]
MISFFVTLGRMVKAITRSWQDAAFRTTLFLTLAILISSTVFYHNVEGWSWIDSAYFSVMVATTVGLGDFSPTTPGSKVFTMIYALVSIGIFVALMTQIAQALLTPIAKRGKKSTAKKRNKKSAAEE